MDILNIVLLQHHFSKSLEELETSVPSLFCQKQERKTNDRIASNYSSHLSLSFPQSVPPWMKIYMFFLILSFCFPPSTCFTFLRFSNHRKIFSWLFHTLVLCPLEHIQRFRLIAKMQPPFFLEVPSIEKYILFY